MHLSWDSIAGFHVLYRHWLASAIGSVSLLATLGMRQWLFQEDSHRRSDLPE